MSSLSSTLSNLPYISFLSTYPHPAFILASRIKPGQSAPSLNPVFGNPAFRSLLFGPDEDTSELNHAFLKALGNAEQAQRFGEWVERAQWGGQTKEETCLVEIKPRWTPMDTPPVLLELTRTSMNDFLVCTSVPRTPIPKYTPTMVAKAMSDRQGRNFSLTLPDFPPLTTDSALGDTTLTAVSASVGTAVPGRTRSRSLERNLEHTAKNGGAMRNMIENHDWHSTPLGARNTWPSSLVAMVNFMLLNPFPTAIWWGPELFLMYNDAYAEMAGTKHPRIFAQSGSISWSEIWESIGPLVRKVQAGESVAKQDDLLFFDRLTDANFHEECYHTWSGVPVLQEDGTVGGMLNSTFETTQKVITERRLDLLHDLFASAGLARSEDGFADAILQVLRANTIDAPFAAFYFADTQQGMSVNRSKNEHRKAYIVQPVDEPTVKIDLRLAGTVGIPTSHPSTPYTHELLLDSVTLRPLPPMRSMRSSPPQSNLPSQNSSPDNVPGTTMSPDTLGHFYFRPGNDSSMSADANIRSNSSTASSITVVPEPSRTAVIWPFAQAFSSRRPIHVQHIPDYVVEGFELRGWGEHAREAVVIPIAPDDAVLPDGLLILGLNSRRPYDDDYAAWIDLTRVSLNALLTAVKGREADLRRAEQLAELDKAKTSFFSNVSHELRTPLTLIAGPLQDSISRVAEPKVKETLMLAARNASRLSRLVDSLMDFSKLAANRLDGRFKAVQLGTFTADLALLFRSVIEKNNIEYNVICDTDEKIVCYVDPDFWEKIVFNLIGNAFKYTLRGSIIVSLEYDDKNAYFRVTDTGVGIPEEDRGKIFDRFYRVESISRSREGTGIGLALTKELVKLHGGTLSVLSATEDESPLNHGCCFTASIPLGKEHLSPAHIVQNADGISQSRTYARGVVEEATHWSSQVSSGEKTPSESSDSGGSSEWTRMDPRTLFFVKTDIILIVDDNEDMRRYMKSLLSPYCQVLEAHNGQEALEIVNSVKPSIIVSDLTMPVLDGFGTVGALRQRPDTRLIPIILVTAKENEDARVEGLLSGADDYLGKPFNSRELIARVHLQMQLGKRRVELEARFMERTREIQLLSDLSPVGIFRADHDGHMLYANQRWWEISGHDRSLSIDDWPMSVSQDDADKVLHAWRTAVDTHTGTSLEFQFKTGIYAKGQFEPLMTDSGVSSGVIGTITDVSDQRLYEAAQLAHVQEREASARRRAEEAEERRHEADEQRRGQELLIDVTSHELRQPVSAILNCSSLIRSNLALLRDELWYCHSNQRHFNPSRALIQVIDEDIEALDAIYQCGLAQERIANDVLSLSRIQLQVLSIQPVEFELVAEVKRIVSIFRIELKMKNIDLDVIFGESIDRFGVNRVRSDKARFGQVVTNLLSNGIKFADTSTDKRDILVSVHVSPFAPPVDGPCVPPLVTDSVSPDLSVPTVMFVYVNIKDSGPGLKPDDLALLFKRFQQGSNSHNAFGGSGLGLFVSRKLCELMGGRIDVDSVYGEGATFRFFVQVTTAPDDMSTPNSSDIVPYLHLPASPTDLHTKYPLHILITEDNLINQTVLNRQLKNAGHTTTLASHGLQAIEKIRAFAQADRSHQNPPQKFDVILMDCEMPVMDGLTAVREIRKLEASGELPCRHRIYALTGNARAGQIQSAHDAGMDDVIIKPYKLDELLAKIQSQ